MFSVGCDLVHPERQQEQTSGPATRPAGAQEAEVEEKAVVIRPSDVLRFTCIL